MVTDRRTWLRLAAAAAMSSPWAVSCPAWVLAAAGSGRKAGVRLAASWAQGDGHQVGVWTPQGQDAGAALVVSARLDVPTRAHGLCLEPGGTLLSVARRPGDWMLRWRVDGQPIAWCWIEPDRAFNGHVLHSPDGRRLYTTETDLDTGMGLVGVRDAATLAKLAEWPTGGQDPHALVWLARAGRAPALVVANGGIPTRAETGRVKLDRDRMDASLVCLEGATGAIDGLWRLEDRRLSIRHLAWHPTRHLLGIALQAEHDDPGQRRRAPVLAVWDGIVLRTADASAVPLEGYGGDIAATSAGFAVSAPKVNRVALWSCEGRWLDALPLPQACALAAAEEAGLWMAGPADVARMPGQALAARGSPGMRPVPRDPGPRLDNHWILL